MSTTVLTAGFAMFSMFFGSGNLVFPLLLGTQTLAHYPFAMPGFFLTAVIVPFLGLLSMIAFDGNRERFFGALGKTPGFILTLMILALIGPFGVIPRCITVAYGGLQLISPDLSFPLFSAFFCIATGLLILKPNRVVDIIGLFLTPFKLGGLLLLVLLGLYFAKDVSLAPLSEGASFKLGAGLGYQTMDLIAAFFFSATIVSYLRERLSTKENPKNLLKASIVASLIGALLLSVMYFGFITLGAKYAPYLGSTRSEALLAAIANHTLGANALIIVSITLAVSCLATAVILANLFVDFLRKDTAQNLLNFNLSQGMGVLLSMVITYGISLMGFDGICKYLGMILEIAYPALIGLALHHILSFWYKLNHAKLVFWGVLSVSVFYLWVI